MEFTKKILDFILFRYSYQIPVNLSPDEAKELIINRFVNDRSFFLTEFIDFNFTFSHKNFLPEVYNYSLVFFEGKIISDRHTSIQITAKIFPLFLWIFILAIAGIFIAWFLNLGGIQTSLEKTPFPFHPLYAPLFLLFWYIYYAFKIFDVKRLFKVMIRIKKN